MASAATGSPESTASTEEVAVSSQPVRGSAWRRAVGTLALAVLLTACTATHEGQGHRAGPGSAASPSSPSSDTAQPSCPASYVPPRADRPRVALTFAVAPDLATVRGTERITFTPDRSVTELVFRLTANTAPTAATGTKIVVTSAQADPAAGDATFSPDGADPSTQGGLLHIPFRRQLPAGTQVTADLAFTVTLGDGSFDRIGRVDRSAGPFAWFASAHPLLAWEYGYGWHTEPMLQFAAESATSEAMRTDLTVTAPAADTVLASGNPTTGERDGDMRIWHATLGRGAGRERGRRPLPGQRHQSRFSGAARRRTQHSRSATRSSRSSAGRSSSCPDGSGRFRSPRCRSHAFRKRAAGSSTRARSRC